MHIYIEAKNKNTSTKFEGTGKQLCKELGVNVETVLIVQNGTLVAEDELLKDSDEIKLLSVISGG